MKQSPYAQLYAQVMADPSPYKSSVDSTWVAKIIRYELDKKFPAVKFSVRTSKYSDGSSIDIDWTDGPTTKQVNAVVNDLEGADFDGMIDLKSYRYHWLTPTGLSFASTPGTEGSRGTKPAESNPNPSPEAIKVHLRSDYIFSHRDLSDGFLSNVLAKFNENWGTAYTVYQYKQGLIRQDDRQNHGYFLNVLINETEG